MKEKEQLRIVTENFDGFKTGDIIKVLDRNVAQIRIKSLNKRESVWIWGFTLILCTDKLESGL